MEPPSTHEQKRHISRNDVKELSVQARKASELLKAISHETRLTILCLLAEGELSVSEIEDIIDLPQATVSQLLARLRFASLVTTRREGRTIYYRVANGEISQIIESLHMLFCSKE